MNYKRFLAVVLTSYSIQGVCVILFYVRRFDPQLSKLHDVVSSGQIGQLRYIHQTSRDPISQMTELYLKNSGVYGRSSYDAHMHAHTH